MQVYQFISKQIKKCLYVIMCTLIFGGFSTSIYAEKLIPSQIINEDGTLDAYRIGEQSFSMSLVGWDVRLDPELGPMLSPSQDPSGPWSALEQGLNGVVHAMAVNGGSVYVGGQFTGVGEGGTPVEGLNNIARWDINEQKWYALDKGLNNIVYTIASQGNDVIVGGYFSGVGNGGSPVSGLNAVAKWNGQSWNSFNQGLAFQGRPARVRAIAFIGQDIYFGGGIITPGGMDNFATTHIVKWNGTNWEALGDGLNEGVYDMMVGNSGELYVCGNFTKTNARLQPAIELNYIAKWENNRWTTLGKGLDSRVHTMAKDGDNIIVGGEFTGVATGGEPTSNLNKVAKWDGQQWTSIGKGLRGTVYSCIVNGPDYYFAGDISQAVDGGNDLLRLNHIVKWDGSSWTMLDNGLNSNIKAIASDNKSIYAAGTFAGVGRGADHISGLNHIAKWTLEQNDNNALHFDGNNDYITLGNPIFYNGPFTLEGWYKADADAGASALFTLRTGRMTGVYVEYMKSRSEEDGKLRFLLRNPPSNAGGLFVVPNIRVKAEEWFHIAAVKNTKGDISLYVNGELQETVGGRHKDLNTDGLEVVLGYNVAPAARFYKGLMDEVRIWTKAKSEAEIKAGMNTTLQGNEPNLMVYYNFNQGQAASDNTTIKTIDNKASSAFKGRLEGFEMKGSDSNLLNGKKFN